MNFLEQSYYVRGRELFRVAFSTGAYAHAAIHIGPLWIEIRPPWGRGANAKEVIVVRWVRTWLGAPTITRGMSGWIR